MTTRAETVTILFTDLVNSTELLQRVGDETAQRVFETHHRLLRDAVSAHGGAEVKWTGDGLMVAFASATAAVRCAIAMQQAARRPAAGERLQIRVGLQVGEALRHDATDYFGTTVVIASRLCAQAESGEILCSALVRGLIPGSSEFDFIDRGERRLKGIAAPVSACEIRYEHDPLAMLTVTPFVGREDVMTALTKKLDDARTGKGSLVMLVGEPGIGKTRTAEEFAAQARQSGAMVLRGRCYDGDWAAPFSPFMEAIKEYASAAPEDELIQRLGLDAGVLARIVPMLRERLPNIEEPLQIPAEGERYRLLEAAGDFFARMAEARPLALMLDDLHWADKGTIAMLQQVARVAPQHALLIVGAYRDVELDLAHPLADALTTLRRETNYERIVLKGLESRDVGELLSLVAEQDVPEEFARAISEETGGNPFFIREVMLHLVEEKKIVQEDGRWASSLSLAEMRIPEGVREVIGRRLSRVNTTCNRMLTVASALTAGFTWDAISALVDADDAALLDAVDEALAAQLIVERERGSYDFTHALIRHTLYEELSTPRRVLLHRQIGEALERLYASALEPHLAELAHHFYQAAPGGDVEKAIDYSRRAGERATAVFAWGEAIAHYQRALDVIELQPAPNVPLLIDVLLALAGAHLSEGGNEQSRTACALRAVDLSREIDDAQRFALAVLSFAGTHREDGTFDPQLVALIEEALTVVGTDDGRLRPMLLARLSVALWFAGDSERERRRTLMDEALSDARRGGSEETLFHVLRLAVWVWDPATTDAQIANGREMLELAGIAGDRWMALEAHTNVVGPLLEKGDRDSADLSIEACVELQRELHRPGWAASWSAMQADMDGRLADAEPLAAKGYAELSRLTPENATNVFNVQFMSFRRTQGRQLEIEDAVRSAVERVSSTLPAWGAALALLYAEADRIDEARAAFEAVAVVGFASIAFDRNWTPFMWLLADVCAILDDVPCAETLYALLRPYQDLCVVISASCIAIVYGGSLQRPLGALATTLARWDDAERHYEAAIRVDSAARAPGWVARARLSYGDMLLRRDGPGDGDRAVALLQQALDFAKESGMGKVQADAERLLASISA